MSKSGLLIIGATGHGRMVADIAVELQKWDKIAFLDDRDELSSIYGFPILGQPKHYDVFKNMYDHAFAAYVNSVRRLQWIEKLFEAGYQLPEIISPFSFVSKKAKIGEGCLIMPGTVINAGTALGKGCIISSGCTIGHDCLLGEGVNVSAGVQIGGNVTIGSRSCISIGSSIANNINIGNDCLIKDGSVVVSDIAGTAQSQDLQ